MLDAMEKSQTKLFLQRQNKNFEKKKGEEIISK